MVAALGDSITAGSPLWDPDPAVRERIPSPDERSQYGFWAAERLDDVALRNCGAFGERTDEIAARLDECADGAEALIVQGGVNDIAQGREVADAARSLREMVERGRELGLDTYLTEVLPWNNAYPSAAALIDELNARIEGIAKATGVPLIRFYETLEDPRRPGRMKAEWTDDGDHPSVAGYRRLGGRVAGALRR